MIDNKELLVVSFSHVNYLVHSSGTEKFTARLSKTMKGQGIHHVNFFSFYHKRLILCGVNYDDKFMGVFLFKDAVRIIEKIIETNNLCLSTIHIQHLMNYNVETVKEIVMHFDVPVVYFVHDFYSICNNYRLIDTNGFFCGKGKPCVQKCSNCENAQHGYEHHQKIEGFLHCINNRIYSVICPSVYVQDVFTSSYGWLKSKTIVRPHINILVRNPKNRDISDRKIKVGFAGGQMPSKGFEKWEEIVSKLDANNYEFFYFGTGKKVNDRVKNVYVSISEQGENAMMIAVQDSKIDISFQWPLCPETYSYVYYEMSSCGAYIITNSTSGNIADQVLLNKNGKVFDRLEDCLEWFDNITNVRDEIKEKIEIEYVGANEDLRGIIYNPDHIESSKFTDSIKHIHELRLLSLIYRLKYHIQ